jgi:hypothetical protein
MTHHSQCKDKRDLIYGVLGLIKHPEQSLIIDHTCSKKELICSILSCYKGRWPIRYYEKLIARLGAETVQCFTYAKRVVGRQLVGDVGRLLALQAFYTWGQMIYPITNINEQTADPRYVDHVLEMCLASTWEATDGHYRQYHATEPPLGYLEKVGAKTGFSSGKRSKFDPETSAAGDILGLLTIDAISLFSNVVQRARRRTILCSALVSKCCKDGPLLIFSKLEARWRPSLTMNTHTLRAKGLAHSFGSSGVRIIRKAPMRA